MIIDVAIPTRNSEGVLENTLNRLAAAERNSDAEIGTVLIEDAEFNSQSRLSAIDHHGLTLEIRASGRNLASARQALIRRVETEWVLFLDDDVRIPDTYLSDLIQWTEPERVGAVHGRTHTQNTHTPTRLSQQSDRGTAHATLVRRAAVEQVTFPPDLTLFTGPFLRRYVESQQYKWILDHQAEFTHPPRNRHSPSWLEGELAGVYDFATFPQIANSVFRAVSLSQNPIPHTLRALGWIAGRLQPAPPFVPNPDTLTDESMSPDR